MNARKELMELVLRKGIAPIECAYIERMNDGRMIELKVGYSSSDFEDFLAKLNFNYEEAYGAREIFGIIWLKDGTWCTRDEEWWVHNKRPDIPSNLK